MDARPIQYAKTSDGVSIAYCVLGAGVPLVFTSNTFGDVHWYSGDPGARGVIDSFVDAGCCVVRYDGRGMGASDRDVADFSLTTRLLDLEAVVASAEIERFAVCGYAHGGPPAIAYATKTPERVSHLLLVNTFASMAAYYETVPVMRAVAGMRAMAGDQWEFVTQTIASAVTGFGDSEAAKRTAALFRAGMSAEAYFAYLDAGYGIDVSELLPQVRVPTLVAYDSSVDYAGKHLLQALATGIPNARFVAADDYASVGLEFLGMKPAIRKQPIARPSEAGTAIILFADIADSTALTERLGDAAFREKARELDEALRRAITSNGGTAIDGKLVGDGVLATFGAAREAIACALAIHRMAGPRAKGQGPGPNDALLLHVGIHAGDVIREEGNVYGGAVNIAARVAGEAAAGETLVSATVRDLARTSAGVAFEDRGERELKGVGEPVRVWSVKES